MALIDDLEGRRLTVANQLHEILVGKLAQSTGGGEGGAVRRHEGSDSYARPP